MSAVQTEHVLVVSTQYCMKSGISRGLHRNRKISADSAGSEKQLYRPRPAMEQDPSFKQLIPYVLIRHGVGEQLSYSNTRGAAVRERVDCIANPA